MLASNVSGTHVGHDVACAGITCGRWSASASNWCYFRVIAKVYRDAAGIQQRTIVHELVWRQLSHIVGRKHCADRNNSKSKG
eukprot:1477025-Amphidinium_carterae.1